MQTYINALVQTSSAFAVTQIDREDFEEYVQRSGLIAKYPGIQGIGYTARIPAERLSDHIEEMRRDGFTNYTVWPEFAREEYFSIVYLEPFEWRNQRAFGYDMFTEPTRRAAMAAARDSGRPAASGRVTLVQEVGTEQQPGFLIYVPVYRSGMPTATVGERREALQGFVYSPFRAHDLFEAIRVSHLDARPDIYFHVFDSAEIGRESLLFGDMTLLKQNPDPGFRSLEELNVAGRTWTLAISTRPAFDPLWTRFGPLAVLMVGIAITGLVFATFRANRNERTANEKTAALLKQVESQNADLEIINEVGQKLTAELDLEKLVQSITDAATRLCKAEFGALFYKVTDEEGESLVLYTLSGAPREAFEKFPLPRNTGIFEPTFMGERIVRSDNITQDERYGKHSPHRGMPTGHLPVVSYLAVPVTSRSGEVIGGLVFGHSKPAMFREREERLVAGIASQAAIAIDNARLFKRAQQAVQIRDDFLSIASHEFRSPLSTLSMQLQIFRRMSESTDTPLTSERIAKGLNACERQVSRLAALVDDLLDVTQIEAGRLSFHYEHTDLVDLVKTIFDGFCESNEAVSCELYCEVTGAMVVDCDPFRIEQVMMNLLSNAVKYGEGKPIGLAIRRSEDGSQAIVAVSDSGMGIDADSQARIFDRFHRAVSHESISGLGLGLFISNQIVAAHGGTIEVNSTPGRGSTFTVYLPLLVDSQTSK
ncbi:GAF domain-containing protein [Proteobacteria bacterium 005FR1]|nr:GAF domain-containing protein [Proteobacteria bacterium 005FR1]